MILGASVMPVDDDTLALLWFFVALLRASNTADCCLAGRRE